jgi:ABC-type sugar transport system substrate-binding protein
MYRPRFHSRRSDTTIHSGPSSGTAAEEVDVSKACLAVAALATGLLVTTTAAASPRPVRVGVILKGLDNPFFVAMYEGARAEAGRRHVSASFRAATNVDDAAGQAARARALVGSGKYDCYVLNPITGTNLVPAFRGLKRPVINVDSPIDRAAATREGMRIKTYIGTDDFAAGELAARQMKAELRGRAEVALIGGYAGNVGSIRRLGGFAKGLDSTRITIVARANAGYDRERAQLAARRILQDHPKVAGFFAANDVMALGIADAVQAAGKRGRVDVIGMDAIPAALDAIRTGQLTATVAQYPYMMGRMAIEACIAVVRGATLPARVNAPIVLVTKKNVTRVSGAFPLPPQRYADPFAQLLRKRG